ncbi:MAG: hypothetical protein QM831_27855 [Kofleriaceae bacterium]
MANRLLLGSLFLGLLGGVAAADDQPAGDMAQPPDPAAAPPPTVPDGGGGGGMWSTAVVDRPLTMPKGKVGVYADFDVLRISSSDGMGNSVSATAEALRAGFGYGVDDKLEIGAQYQIQLHDFEGKGPLYLYGDYQLYHKDKLTIGGNVDLLLNFNGVDAMGGSTVNLALEAGLGVRYRINPQIAVFTGNPLAPQMLGQHLHIGLNNSQNIGFDIPVGVELQANPQFYASLATNIAHLGFSNDSSSVIFADFITVDLNLRYAVNKNLDVGAFLDLPDLKNAQFDVLVFGIGASYYAL